MNNPCDKCYLSIRNLKTAGREVGWTSTPAKNIMFIGDAPSITDYKTGSLFNGRSTKLVTRFIDDYKLTAWSIKTNLIKCVCLEPNEHYADKCYFNLVAEIQKYKPTIIVTVGHFVYRFLKEDNYRNIATVVNKPILFNSSILIPIYSPVYITRTKNFSEYVKSFELISNIFADLCKEYRYYRD